MTPCIPHPAIADIGRVAQGRGLQFIRVARIFFWLKLLSRLSRLRLLLSLPSKLFCFLFFVFLFFTKEWTLDGFLS